MNKRGKFKVVQNVKIAKDVYKMILEGDTKDIVRAGPISICDYDEKSVTIIYKVVGKGTEIMSGLNEGTELDVLTGLGNGFDLNCDGDRPLIIGGGVVTPPMYRLCKDLIAEGKKPVVILGFGSKEDLFFEEEFKALGVDVYVSTVDGSVGTKGFVTDVMKELNDYTYFYACGPMVMLKAICGATDKSGQVSLEERMGCGFGACMGCTIKTNDGYKRVCKEGPVFRKESLIWE